MNAFLPSTAFAFSCLKEKLFSKNILLQAEMQIVLCYLMASHSNSMAFNLRIPSFIVAFLRVRRWIVHNASMQFRHLLYSISSSATRRAGGYKPLAKSLKKLKPKLQAFKSVLSWT